jgi:DNA-binding NarL/FixJ family response regulator
VAGILIRVAIVDDHPVVAAGVASLLRSEPDIDVVGVASSIEEARATGLDAADATDVLLLDLRLGERSGLDLLTASRDSAPRPARPAIIVLTAYDYPQYAEAALRLGAAGFVLKTAPLPDLLDAIRRVAGGGLAFAVRPTTAAVRLTPRERDVLRLVVDGRTNDEIGLALGIGSKTVETHLTRVFDRLDVASRTELASRALREGWLDVPD